MCLNTLLPKKALQINFFELASLNNEMRKCFMKDYQGPDWFWHRFVWRLPTAVFSFIENVAVMLISFIYSPKESVKILKNKMNVYTAQKKIKNSSYHQEKVGKCFKDNDVKNLAQLMRNFYSSILWKSGDILLVDNRKVVHAGMPGQGPRLIRALICNPIDMQYSFKQPGYLYCQNRTTDTVGSHMVSGPSSP